MLRKLAPLFFSFLFSTLATAEPQGFEGLTVLAGFSPRFPTAPVLESLREVPHPAVQLLWGTFGTSTAFIEAFANAFRDREHLIYIHLTNGSCRRHHRCYSGEFFPATSVPELNARWERNDPTVLRAFLQRRDRVIAAITPLINDNTTVFLTAELEDNFSEKAYANVEKALCADSPFHCSRNPVTGRGDHPELIELHTPAARCAPAVAVSLDGFDDSLPEQRRWVLGNRGRKEGCYALFLWRSNRWQGRYFADFLAPQLRHIVFDGSDVRFVKEVLK